MSPNSLHDGNIHPKADLEDQGAQHRQHHELTRQPTGIAVSRELLENPLVDDPGQGPLQQVGPNCFLAGLTGILASRQFLRTTLLSILGHLSQTPFKLKRFQIVRGSPVFLIYSKPPKYQLSP
jgi:hypothetical protein